MAIERVNVTFSNFNDIYRLEDEKKNNIENNDRQEVTDQRFPEGMYERMCKQAEFELEESDEEIEELKKCLDETIALLNVERGRSRHLQAVNKRLERDIDRIAFDEEELRKESELFDHLLESKDKEIESLFSQINLLVQTGTMKEKNHTPIQSFIS
mmetsp:Transcript_13015/g.20198  ORF Transcript_13015/g.20198 Transcript_13015/m.20198 type:complete len:156 (+) Transcript_13015:107-574(+)